MTRLTTFSLIFSQSMRKLFSCAGVLLSIVKCKAVVIRASVTGLFSTRPKRASKLRVKRWPHDCIGNLAQRLGEAFQQTTRGARRQFRSAARLGLWTDRTQRCGENHHHANAAG